MNSCSWLWHLVLPCSKTSRTGGGDEITPKSEIQLNPLCTILPTVSTIAARAHHTAASHHAFLRWTSRFHFPLSLSHIESSCLETKKSQVLLFSFVQNVIVHKRNLKPTPVDTYICVKIVLDESRREANVKRVGYSFWD